MKSYIYHPILRAGYYPYRNTSPSPALNPLLTYVNGTENKLSVPAANIVRKEGAFEIKMAVPGLPKDQIRIEVNEDQLVVSAADTKENTEQPKFIRHEFDFAGFKRIFRLHKNADITAFKAAFDQGILTIVIPDKVPETIKIDIQ